MMSDIAFIVSGEGSINLYLEGIPYMIASDHFNFDKIKEALSNRDLEELKLLVDIPTAIEKFCSGKVEIIGDEVFWDDAPMHNILTSKILELLQGGYPFEPFVRFLDKLMENPSFRAVNELYSFLEKSGLAICEDGDFISYKGIRKDWRDKYSGTIDNSIGAIVEIPRHSVCDDPTKGCSEGLHVGSIDYVKSYCTERVVLVKINPKDVVSVPLTN